jgi:hypothetical protein
MSGAWELGGPSVLVAILTREIVAMKWAIGFRNMQLPPNSATSFHYGAPFDDMRNAACQKTLEQGFEWLFFLDDDVVVPPDTIQRLINHRKDIVSGVYHRRAEPVYPVMLNFLPDGNATWLTTYPKDALIDVDLVGAGCLLIHRRVLERVAAPWFEWQLDMPQPPRSAKGEELTRLSEDFAFCRKAKRDYGFGVHVDTSIQCEHIGLGQSVAGGAFVPSKV